MYIKLFKIMIRGVLIFIDTMFYRVLQITKNINNLYIINYIC